MDVCIDSGIRLQPSSQAWTSAQPAPSGVPTPVPAWNPTHATEGEPLSFSCGQTPQVIGRSAPQDPLGLSCAPFPPLSGLFLHVSTASPGDPGPLAQLPT